MIEAYRYDIETGQFVKCAVSDSSIVRFESINGIFFYPTKAILIDETEVYVNETIDEILGGCYDIVYVDADEEYEDEDDLL